MGDTGMDQYTQPLYDLQEQITRQGKLKNMIASLQGQKISLEQEENLLALARSKEQADVDRLEGGSLSAFYYSIIGKKEEQMEKERQEAYAAAVKHDGVCKQLKNINQDIERYTDELMELSSCEKEYEQLLSEKTEYMKKTDSINGPKILHLEEQLRVLQAQRKEMNEAYLVGVSTVNQIQSIMDSLGSAEGWGTWDLVGGGMISDMIKHSHLDDAQLQIEKLQELLRRYKTELADVQILTEMQANIDGFLYFADLFFDGLFADWAVLDRIQNSQSQVEDTYRQIEQVQRRLDTMSNDLETKMQQTQTALNELVLYS